MKAILKRLMGTFLAFSIAIGSVGASNTTQVDAATSCIKNFKANTTYSYDLDGNKTKEKIKFTKSYINYRDYKIKLYINGKYVTSAIVNDYETNQVRLFDFYSKDKSKEIYIQGDSVGKIVKYNKGKYIIKTISGLYGFDSYNSSTGIVKIYRIFDDEILMTGYSEYKVSGYTITKQPINYGLNPDMMTIRYKALKDIKAYKSPTSSKVAFTIKKGDIVYAVATYSKGSKKYIEFITRSSKNKDGWVKVSSLSKVPSSMFKDIGYPNY